MINSNLDAKQLAIKYLKAKDYVIQSGYDYEINYYNTIKFEQVTEQIFLKEMAWVILTCGMNEKVIRSKFDSISEAFFNWSVEEACNNLSDCRDKALLIFNNTRKINAITNIIALLSKDGIESIKQCILKDGISYLKEFPYIGDVTAYHIAKNLGFNYSKPDRHLKRIAVNCGYDSPHVMCTELSKVVGEEEKIIDLVLWRFATLNRNYIEFFQ